VPTFADIGLQRNALSATLHLLEMNILVINKSSCAGVLNADGE
jgi:hypothetical protein